MATPYRHLRVIHYHQREGVHPPAVPLSPNHYCIELMTGGRGWVRHESDWIEVQAGDLLWHRPGQATIGRSDFDNPYRCLAVRFYLERPERELPRFSRWESLDEVKRFTQEVVTLFVDERFDNGELAEYLISRLAFQVRLHHFQKRNEAFPAPLRRVLSLIEERYAESLSVAVLAREAGWSEPHLHEVFRQHLGQTPHQLLLERRIRAAKERLGSTDHPIKQIAAACGFSSAAAFCAVFGKHTGLTPANYRREQQWLGAGAPKPR